MSRTVRAALIQAHANLPKQEAIDKHVLLIEQAAAQGAQVTCLQEIFFGPYFCAQQEPKWFETAEPDDGPTVQTMRELERKHEMVLVVPSFEKELEGVFYNTAVVIDADGSVVGKYRKTHIPQVGPIFWEK
ncbi:MAG: nitrilase-related carbon-nitrogen hydrolase [Microbacterium sp.]